jgi:hypothetical protein
MSRPFKEILIILGIDKYRSALDTSDDNVVTCPWASIRGFRSMVVFDMVIDICQLFTSTHPVHCACVAN